MWMLMYIGYLLMGMSFMLLALTGLMGYFQFTVWNANHIQFALISSILYMFTETLIMFYFIITGKKIKEYIKLRGGNTSYDRIKLIDTIISN